jgi:methyltransferase (TIGR00027 family)
MTMAKRSPVAQTAFGPMVIAAVEQHHPDQQRVIRDDLAIRFLPWGMRLMAHACRWGWLRKAIIKASEKQAPGAWGGMLGRKRYADDQVTEALEAGVSQVVILGAGLDTRAYRLVAPAGAAAYELDLPENVAYKRERLQSIFGGVPDHVTLVPIDFGTDDLAEALADNGFRIDRPAMFVWEAVTQYLSDAAVRKTLEVLAKAAPGSRTIFTYVPKDFLDGKNFYGAEKMYQEFVVKYHVWHYGLMPDQVSELLSEYSWVEREQVGADEYLARYLQPLGRPMPVMAIERFVSAAKP